MNGTVSYRGTAVGTVDVVETVRGLRFTAKCRRIPDTIVRLYAAADKGALRIGVLEPQGAELTLTRELTHDALRQAGVSKTPSVYWLDDGAPGCIPFEGPEKMQKEQFQGLSGSSQPQEEKTSPSEDPPFSSPNLHDELLEAAVQRGSVACVRLSDRWRLSCPFNGGESPLAFALTACRIEDACAVLELPFAEKSAIEKRGDLEKK